MKQGRSRTFSVVAALILVSGLENPYRLSAVERPTPPSPPEFTFPRDDFDYVKRTAEIPMRDGVKLHTVIVVPKSAGALPILLTRTPYDADAHLARSNSPTMLGALGQGDEVFVQDGYIRVFQDIRGRHGSEGEFIVTRPPRGALNSTGTDDSTDAYDTIDWLVKNVPESNGRVGMIGSSYEGWTVVMALLDPHPALKVAAPESPMIDGWMGDDWFHYGAFRQISLNFFTGIRSAGEPEPRFQYDDYTAFLEKGAPGLWAEHIGLRGFWSDFAAHPAYDAFWQGQALDRILAAKPSNVPTLWEQGLWDQEDLWGAIHSWEALKAAGHLDNNFLVLGPWRHSQVNADGFSLGPFQWNGDTVAQYDREVLLPFFDKYLKDRPMPAPMPQVMIYNTGENHWDRFRDWPGARQLTSLYLRAGFGLSFEPPAATEDSDSYVSDPRKPVPYTERPINYSPASETWRTWLVRDQRFVSDRPDVLVYQTPILTKPVRVQGTPIADLFAATTGTDGDFIVKVIDVFPGEMPDNPKLGGYELAISLDIFRGRYRHSFSNPAPIPAGQVQEYKFRLPSVNHVFEPGHRIMVQIQSTLFPLYDRNPQTYVPNILFAQPAAFHAARVTLEHGHAGQSSVLLPLVTESAAEH
jgi:putative CocE/NonD family hydrolase